MHSHTEGGLAMGKGFPIIALGKPKLNTTSLTECKLVGANESVLHDVQSNYGDALSSSKMRYTHLEACEEESVNDMRQIMLWTCYFLLEQGKGIVENLLLQNNKSSILLEQNGKTSSKVNMKKISIEWCLTKDMVSNFMTKPLHGNHFKRLRDYIMGKVHSVRPNGAKGVTWKDNV